MKFLNPISFIDSSGNEVKLDNNVVFKNGAQTITGSKTFTTDLNVDGGSTQSVGINVISGSGSGSRNLRLFNASYDGNTRGLYDSGSGTYIINISYSDNRIGLTVDDANIRSNIEAKKLEVDFINLNDPEGRTNMALPNVCSMNMGDDTTLFDCDAAGKIGLIGRDDPIHPEQNPNHTTGIRFFRSSSNNTITSDYADFYYDSSNDRFEVSKKIYNSTQPGLDIIKDSNNILKIGDNIITQKKLIYSNSNGYDLVNNLNISGNFVGKPIEIEYVCNDASVENKYYRTCSISSSVWRTVFTESFPGTDAIYYYGIEARVSTTNLSLHRIKKAYPSTTPLGTASLMVYNVYEIIS